MANYVIAFSGNSMNIALPLLAVNFGVSQSVISWLSLIYNLLPCCTLLIFGRLGDIYGYKRQFMVGFVFFGVVSILTPFFATNLAFLIFCRALQGMSYSMLISITQAIVSLTFDSTERGMALGINSAFVSVGSASGPTIGGFLLKYFDWRAIFLFNVPFCVVGFIVAMLVLEDDKHKEAVRGGVDWCGALFFAVFIGTLILGLNFSGEWGMLSARFLGCIAVSALAIAFFIRYEASAASPIMRLDLFKNRTFSLSNTTCACNYMTQQMIIFMTPFFLIDILSMGPDRAGLVMLAYPSAIILSSPLGGRMADKYGARPPAIMGLLMIIAGSAVLSALKESSSTLMVTAMLLLVGIGNGYSVSAVNTSIFSTVPRDQSGVASGIVATMRTVGQTIGISCATVVLALRQTVYSANPLLDFNGAYLKAQRDTFFFGIFITTVALILVYKLPGAPSQKNSKGRAD
jgi:EmrB/QacA subfamily drug resistance transporter